MINAPESTSTRPYLIRALYEWCTDNGFTPHVAVAVDATVSVPREYVKNGEIVLNISTDATSALHLGNDVIEFKGRFAGIARDIMVPIDRVMAVYARENGQGMAFPMNSTGGDASKSAVKATGKSVALASVPSTTRQAELNGNIVPLVQPKVPHDHEDPPPNAPRGRGRPSLTRVK
jgi:stringent starvation protein B